MWRVEREYKGMDSATTGEEGITSNLGVSMRTDMARYLPCSIVGMLIALQFFLLVNK